MSTSDTHTAIPTVTTSTSLNPPQQHSSSTPSIPLAVRVRNRRKRYLEAHPSYFGSSLESAAPLLYDRLIRAHQTEAERIRERSNKGFAGTLEADLLRSEAKLDEVKARQSRSTGQQSSLTATRPSTSTSTSTTSTTTTTSPTKQNGLTNGNGNSHSNKADPTPSTSSLTPLPTPMHDFSGLSRDEAQQHWHDLMTLRFLAGEDDDFDYSGVDNDERWDDLRGEERDREDEWFDGEEEAFVGVENECDDEGEVEGKGRELVGETGVQDF